MRSEPAIKRAMAFFDGQNLFYAVKEAFGYPYPNYDPKLLTHTLCSSRGWDVVGIHFYTGVPSAADKAFWNHFWMMKLSAMGRQGVHTFSRPLRYRNQTVTLPDGTLAVTVVGQEKGVDVRIALDIVRFALDDRYDVALIFSQDQDLTEAVQDVKKISALQNRWIKVASAFPVSPTVPKARGISETDWVRVDRALYDACIDHADYRPKTASP